MAEALESPTSAETPEPSTSAETPWDRFCSAAHVAFRSSDPDDPPPAAPESVKEWGRNTSAAMLVGILFGGVRESLKQKAEGAITPPAALPNAALRTKFIQQANTRRLARVSNAMVSGGVHFGALGALFYGLDSFTAFLRDERDPWNTVLAAAATAAALGSALPGSGLFRARSAVLGAGLGAALGYPVGMGLLALQREVQDSEVLRIQSLPVYLRHEEAVAVQAARSGGLTRPDANKDIQDIIAQFERSMWVPPAEGAAASAPQRQ